jgi:two-component system chemotaxis sensor kinase CheA
VTPEIVDALLVTVDMTRKHVEAIKTQRKEPETDGDLARWTERLMALANGVAGESVTPVVAEEPKPPEERQLSPVVPNAKPNAPAPDGTELSVRVDVKLLDELMKLVGELVLTRNQLAQFVTSAEPPHLVAAAQRLNVVTSELQDRIMLTRMQPLAHIWSRFPRLIRDAAQSCGKNVRLQMEGADTELDRTVIEAMRDPLTHLVRNAVDHGIESPEQRSAAGKPPEAVVYLRAHHEEGQVHIEVEDDGRGIDVAAVRRKAVSSGLLSAADARALSDERVWGLIFAAGFSTRDEVTELSGRGVGMDVVKTDVERVGGRVEINSVAGGGTRITMRLPLTLAILPSVLVECAGETYAIPQANLLELVLLQGDAGKAGIREVGGRAGLFAAW